MTEKIRILIKFVSFMTFALLLTILASPVSADTNLIANPGFETIPLQSWTLITKNGNTPTLDNTIRHSGSVSIKIQASNIVGFSGHPLSIPIKVQPNQEYSFSIWGKVMGITKEAVVRINEIDANNVFLREQYIPFSTGTADWTQKLREFTTLANTDHVYIYASIYNGDGTFWVDDAVLSPKSTYPTSAPAPAPIPEVIPTTTSGSNLVANPGFETIPLQSWTLITKNGNTPTLDNTIRHSGSVSIKIQASNIVGFSGHPLSIPIKVQPNQEYSFSIWGKVMGITKEAVVRINEIDANNVFLRQQYIPFSTGTADWTQKLREFTTLANTDHIYIYASIYNGDGTFWVDDAVLSPKSTYPTSAPAPAPIPEVIPTTSQQKGFQVNQDKTISINGKKTFPVFMGDICSPYADNLYPNYASIPCDVSKFTDFTGEYQGSSFPGYILGVNSPDWKAMVADYENNRLLWSIGIWTSLNRSNLPTSPYFMGYWQPDEPAPGNGFPSDMTEEEVINRVTYYYNNIKKLDNNTNHYVFLTHYKDLKKWLPAADIITYDMYFIRFNNKDGGWVTYERQDSLYVWEIASINFAFGGESVDNISKPVWAILQGNGVIAPVDSTSLYVPYPKEVRANTYLAITLNVNGIAYWGHKIGTGDGLALNNNLLAYYKQVSRELKILNDILVLPTIDYSTFKHQGNVKVKLSKNPEKNVSGTMIRPLNYILKQDGNKSYLIVVNKDSNPITDVTITINGLSGSKIAETLGLETSGSSRAGRTINVNNGQFTDSFDGYAAHIYRIA